MKGRERIDVLGGDRNEGMVLIRGKDKAIVVIGTRYEG